MSIRAEVMRRKGGCLSNGTVVFLRQMLLKTHATEGEFGPGARIGRLSKTYTRS